ncbi:MAG: ATP-binding cassette domain-containing protein, partial [Rhizobiales bacterium]|nr:ATP-binding cassette domain-containing protein [Hyphomicrobiales bacterium]
VRALNGFMALERDGGDDAPSGRKVEIGSVAFKGVTFSYPGASQPTLHGVNFAVRAGERVGVIGRIGSGKTTLGRLMAGFYRPEEGSVLIDGLDARQFSPSDLRQGVGYVAQDAELFAGTLRDNIILGRPGATTAEIEEVVHLAGLDRFVSDDSMGLMMPIGERGRGLSGGQRQAVVLARALLRKPRILFLDEPSSAMDTGFERALIDRLKTFDEEVTLIISTHRTAFLELVDRLIIIDAGRIVADGLKEAVLKSLKAGEYRG